MPVIALIQQTWLWMRRSRTRRPSLWHSITAASPRLRRSGPQACSVQTCRARFPAPVLAFIATSLGFSRFSPPCGRVPYRGFGLPSRFVGFFQPGLRRVCPTPLRPPPCVRGDADSLCTELGLAVPPSFHHRPTRGTCRAHQSITSLPAAFAIVLCTWRPTWSWAVATNTRLADRVGRGRAGARWRHSYVVTVGGRLTFREVPWSSRGLWWGLPSVVACQWLQG